MHSRNGGHKPKKTTEINTQVKSKLAEQDVQNGCGFIGLLATRNKTNKQTNKNANKTNADNDIMQTKRMRTTTSTNFKKEKQTKKMRLFSNTRKIGPMVRKTTTLN